MAASLSLFTALRHCFRTAALALLDLGRLVALTARSRSALSAENLRAGAAFATPTIVHFGAVLLVSALMRVPWPATLFAAIAWGLTGASGLLYTALVGRRIVRQTAYRPAVEDWLFHLVLPLASYALLGAASYGAAAHMLGALFAVAGSALLLLFVGINNAWDAVAYHVFFNIHGSSNERHKKDARTDKK